jgi:5-formyltetrahydrofolate cyclo-ligase
MYPTKGVLRALMRGALKRMDTETIMAQSNRATELLFTLDIWKDVSEVVSFVSRPWEFQTRKIFERAFREGKRVYTPTPSFSGPLMAEARSTGDLGKWTSLTWGYHGPPVSHEGGNPGNGALVLVPGAAFSVMGDRLGWGLGFYDRWLRGRTIITVALALEGQIIPFIPVEDHDVRLNNVIMGGNKNGIIWINGFSGDSYRVGECADNREILRYVFLSGDKSPPIERGVYSFTDASNRCRDHGVL